MLRGAHHRLRIAPEEETDRTEVRAPGAGVQNSAVFCARSASTGVVTRYFSRCLIFWCFWIKPKAQKKSEIDSLFLWESSVPLIGCFLRGADLPPFVTKRWRQKCPPGEKLRETHSASLKRAPVAGLQANRPRFLTLRLHNVLFPLQARMRRFKPLARAVVGFCASHLSRTHPSRRG